MLRYMFIPSSTVYGKDHCSCLQLIRDLKDEISKLRYFIRAEGLEGKVSAFGKLLDSVNVIIECFTCSTEHNAIVMYYCYCRACRHTSFAAR